VRYVLDTNAWIAVLNRDPRAVSRIDAVPIEEIGLPLLALGELLVGARRSRRVAENLATLGELQRLFPVLGVSQAVVERYASIRAGLLDRGIPKGDFDLIIACTALEHGAVLVTNDAGLKDGAIDGLSVEDWLV
jgi:tRNA(fMet)-specific endonuclease VapC